MRIAIIILLTCVNFSLIDQKNSDVSLFFRKDSTAYLNKISSKTGDLYNLFGHHGPAVENE